MSPAADDEPRVGETDLLGSLSRVSRSGVSASARTVWIAFGANVVVGVAKTIAAVVTGSASMLAEAAHSWADTGNEVFLLVANRRRDRTPPNVTVSGGPASTIGADDDGRHGKTV